MPGKVYLVGAGPGHIGLITVRGQEILGRADVLVYDALADDRFLLMVPPAAERIYAGKRADDHRMKQADINALLVEKAKAGKVVVRLKGGDPFVFARGAEECEALAAHGVPFEVVPGVTAACAAGAAAGIPLTHRDLASSLELATAAGSADKPEWTPDFEHLAKSKGTVVVYMGVKALPELARRLIEAGRAKDTPAAVVENATRASQRVAVGTLEDIAQKVAALGIGTPALTIVGEVVKQRERLAWMEKLPLFGRRVVVTRARAQASELSHTLEDLGAEVLEAPTIEIAPPPSYDPLDAAIARLETFDWVVMTSANGVEAFLSRLRHAHKDARALAHAKLATVGSASAQALRDAYLEPDAMPADSNAEALSRVLAATGVQGKRFLIVRALEGREVLPERLRALGGEVELVPGYQTVRPAIDLTPLRERLLARRVDAVTFASSSAVKNFVAHFQPGEAAKLLAGVDVAVIGPVTAQTAKELGLDVTVQPKEATVTAMVEALLVHFAG